MSLSADFQKLEPGGYIRLFELDYTMLQGEVLRFHGHMTAGSIYWKNQEYEPLQISVDGLEYRGDGQNASPTLTLANRYQGVDGVFSRLVQLYDDFAGARLTIRETKAEYLDPINFPDGKNPTASDDELVNIWYIEQKTSESLSQVAFELSSPVDFNRQLLPARQMLSKCNWACMGQYRGDGCGYTGPLYDEKGKPTKDPAKDRCGGCLSDCKVRFGKHNALPFGGFPGAGLVR